MLEELLVSRRYNIASICHLAACLSQEEEDDEEEEEEEEDDEIDLQQEPRVWH
jgi:hypothetical protein